ncbi:MAG: type IV pilin protein [Vicinamibacterales bacterium]
MASGPAHRSSRSGSSEGGFTMIELLVVISIIVILASMGMVQYRNSVIRAREAVLKEDLFRMRDAIDQYYADKNKYPSSLDDLVTDGYLREIPVDPITQSKDTWQVINQEPNVNDATAQPGVYDVKSGSDQTALDGTRYADWE